MPEVRGVRYYTKPVSPKPEEEPFSLFNPSLYGGRLSRSSYWMYCVAVALVYFSAAVWLTCCEWGWLSVVFMALFVLLSVLPVLVKRGYDFGTPGYLTVLLCFANLAFFRRIGFSLLPFCPLRRRTMALSSSATLLCS